jgi:hypothetical protein
VSEFFWKIRGADEVVRQADAGSQLFADLCGLLQMEPDQLQKKKARENFLALGSPKKPEILGRKRKSQDLDGEDID